MTKIFYSLLSVALIFTACTKDDDVTIVTTQDNGEAVACNIDDNYEYDTTNFIAVDFDIAEVTISPDEQTTKLQLEYAGPEDTETISTVGECTGTICQTLEDTSSTVGFRKSCHLTGCYYYYIKYIHDDEVVLATSAEELKVVLGTIDNLDEALLLVYANDYSFDNDDLTIGSSKKVDGGYEVRAFKSDGGCPVAKITSYHLHVCATGEIVILESSVGSKNYGYCY